MRLFLQILLLVLVTQVFGQRKKTLIDKIVGIVGDKIVLLSDIELQYQQMSMEQKVPENFRCQLLEQSLAQKMLLEQALTDSVEVTEDEIESELDRRIRYFVNMIGSEQKLEEYYEKSIVEIKDEFRTDIKQQLLSQKMRSKIMENVKVTPSEVKTFFNSIPEDSLPYFDAEVEVGQIVEYAKVGKIQKQLAKEKAEGIRQRLLEGEDFYFLAQAYSDDPGSSDKGGDLGYIKRGEMVPEFEAVAFRLDSGAISQVVETEFGYHVIQVLDKKGDRIKVRHILIKPEVTTHELQQAKERLDSVRTLIMDSVISFPTAVTLFSEDEQTKHQGGMLMNQQTGESSFVMEQLDKSVYFAIEDLKPGQISEPVFYQTQQGKQAFRIIYLKSETDAHVANLKQDYSKIKAAASSQKEEKEFIKWLEEKIKETYVYVDDSYRDCDNLKNWYKSEDTIKKTYE